MAAPAAEALRAALPPDREQPREQYTIDGALPACAFRPHDAEEVARLLVTAADADLAVVPQGARTALELGRPLERYDVALDLTALDAVLDYQPDDLTVTVQAGLPLERLQTVLAEHGQYLPSDPPPDGRVTVGGLLATARPGAWRGHLPPARDVVLGARVALPDGTLARSGGRVVKNVSGYDLHRLHAGALGAFGVIVEASFKVTPLPGATLSVAVRCASLAVAEGLAFEVRDRALATRALALLSSAAAEAAGLAAAPHLLAEFAGVEAAVRRGADELRSLAAAASASATDESGGEPWARLRALAGPPPGDGGGTGSGVVLRAGVPATALRETVEAAERAGCMAWGHLEAGSVIACAPDLDAAAVRGLRGSARELGGFLQVEAGPAALRATVDPFDAGERDLVRALKQQFDPAGTINRGRWMEGV